MYVPLLLKSGEVSRALELCFQLKQYDVLDQISEDLNEDTNPDTITRVGISYVRLWRIHVFPIPLLQGYRHVVLHFNLIV